MEAPRTTANDAFKQSSSDWYWYSLTAAALFHLVLFAFWPELTAADYAGSSDVLETIELPPEVIIPPPPEQIARPATPVVTSADVNEDITIAPTTFEYNTVDNLPPPPAASARTADIDKAPMYVPMTVRPQLQNQSEIERLLERTYPTILRDAGVGGTPILWFLIDEQGRVLQTRVHTSSGYPALDEAAQKVGGSMRFSPALNRTEPVKVWVEIPVKFQSR